MHRRARLLQFLLLLLLAACGDGSGKDAAPDAPPAACSGFVGDPNQPVELQIVILDAQGTETAIDDGARVPLVQPPQGGKVIFAGIRAKNLDTCGVRIIGSVRDGTTATDRIIGLDGRPVNLLAKGDGWAESGEPMQLASYANIPVCPNHVSSRDVYEQDYQLTLSARDAGNREGTKSLMVRPFCSESQYLADCMCTCRQGYVLGETCSGADAGPTPR